MSFRSEDTVYSFARVEDLVIGGCENIKPNLLYGIILLSWSVDISSNSCETIVL